MFEDMKFRHAFVNLIMDPGVPLEWKPYGISHNAIIKIGIAFDEAAGGLAGSPRQRAIKTALSLIFTDLVPNEAKMSLHTAALGYITKNNEFDCSNDLERMAREHLERNGLRKKQGYVSSFDSMMSLMDKGP